MFLQSWHMFRSSDGEKMRLWSAGVSGFFSSSVQGCQPYVFSPDSSIRKSVRAAYAEYKQELLFRPLVSPARLWLNVFWIMPSQDS
jgi:hypothetical protein